MGNRVHRLLRIRFMLIALLLAAAGCAGGEAVTTQSIALARSKWEKANIQNYNLEWTTTGQRNSRYRVTVRRGKVKRIDSVLPDGRMVEMHPAEPGFYGVDGLFQVIEEELAQLRSENPFGRPRGTTAVLRFTPDPKLGYPRSYQRDVAGTPQGLSLDVIRLDIVPPEAPPTSGP
jgi:Family of unknown function (DUF6174)